MCRWAYASQLQGSGSLSFPTCPKAGPAGDPETGASLPAAQSSVPTPATPHLPPFTPPPHPPTRPPPLISPRPEPSLSPTSQLCQIPCSLRDNDIREWVSPVQGVGGGEILDAVIWSLFKEIARQQPRLALRWLLARGRLLTSRSPSGSQVMASDGQEPGLTREEEAELRTGGGHSTRVGWKRIFTEPRCLIFIERNDSDIDPDTLETPWVLSSSSPHGKTGTSPSRLSAEPHSWWHPPPTGQNQVHGQEYSPLFFDFDYPLSFPGSSSSARHQASVVCPLARSFAWLILVQHRQTPPGEHALPSHRTLCVSPSLPWVWSFVSYLTHCWPLSNRSLNYVGPLTHRFFCSQ